MREIKVLNSNNKILVDDEDYLRCSIWNWSYNSGRTSIWRTTKLDRITIQNYIMKDPENMYDHKDRDILNNQKENLRIATVSQNAANRSKMDGELTSEYKGVSWSKRAKKWRADCQGIYLGYFPEENKAAEAYNKKAIELYGEFANINKIK